MRESGSYQRLVDLTAEKKFIAGRKLLLLDFDGTLVDLAPDIAGVTPPEDLLRLLQRLADLPDCYLVIITGRNKKDIEDLVRVLKIDIVAEHGAIIRENGKWETLLDVNTDWKEKIYLVVKKFAESLPDSFIEDKSFSIAWHYRNLNSYSGKIKSKALIDELDSYSKALNLKIIDGNKVVEIISNKVNKGLATGYLTNKDDFDYILSIGDDSTDEDMFKILSANSNAYTVKIGNGETNAKYSLSNVQQVKMLLNQILTGIENNFNDPVKF